MSEMSQVLTAHLTVKLSSHDQCEEALTLFGSLFLSVLFHRRPTYDLGDKDGNWLSITTKLTRENFQKEHRFKCTINK